MKKRAVFILHYFGFLLYALMRVIRSSWTAQSAKSLLFCNKSTRFITGRCHRDPCQCCVPDPHSLQVEMRKQQKDRARAEHTKKISISQRGLEECVLMAIHRSTILSLIPFDTGTVRRRKRSDFERWDRRRLGKSPKKVAQRIERIIQIIFRVFDLFTSFPMGLMFSEWSKSAIKSFDECRFLSIFHAQIYFCLFPHPFWGTL